MFNYLHEYMYKYVIKRYKESVLLIKHNDVCLVLNNMISCKVKKTITKKN